jgi:hypothetical protein
MKNVLVAMLILIVFSPSGNKTSWAQTAQDQPSLQETMTYIVTFIGNHGCTYIGEGSGRMMTCFASKGYSGCTLTLRRNDVLNGTTYPGDMDITYDLSGVDPGSLTTGPFGSPVPDPNFNRGLAVKAEPMAGKSVYLLFPIDSSENAAHLINALSHAITLCGGKKAAF